MMTAHQDVVPEGDWSMWKYPPFSGEIADGFVWGRGSTDSKCNIQAYMDALELLIAEGFEPEYDLYFGFGYNEEIMGGPEPAAQLIADELRRRNVQLGCLIDECGGIQKPPTVSSMVSSTPVKRDTLILNFRRPIMEAILRFRETQCSWKNRRSSLHSGSQSYETSFDGSGGKTA